MLISSIQMKEKTADEVRALAKRVAANRLARDSRHAPPRVTAPIAVAPLPENWKDKLVDPAVHAAFVARMAEAKEKHRQESMAGLHIVTKIIALAAEVSGCTESEIKGRYRGRKITAVRSLICYICRVDFKRSFPDIGNKLGGRDHSTIMHLCSSWQYHSKTDFGQFLLRGMDLMRGSDLKTDTKTLPIISIVETVADVCNVSVKDIVSQSRFDHVVYARGICFALCKKFSGASRTDILRGIGRAPTFGNYIHDTFESRKLTDPNLAALYQRCEAAVNEKRAAS